MEQDDVELRRNPISYDQNQSNDLESAPSTTTMEVVDDLSTASTERMSISEMMTPFTHITGNNTKGKFLFKKQRSGLLNVLARQAEYTRLVSKLGSINTVNVSDYKKPFRKQILRAYYLFLIEMLGLMAEPIRMAIFGIITLIRQKK